jgi:hypothetical protein
VQSQISDFEEKNPDVDAFIFTRGAPREYLMPKIFDFPSENPQIPPSSIKDDFNVYIIVCRLRK